MTSSQTHITLNTGAKMPIIGLGTWKSKTGEVEAAVKSAIDAGYRHIDCAWIYGNEKEVGAGIKAKIDEGKVKREDLFIVSKLWNTSHKPELVLSALKTSLTNLQLDYLDLYLIHWPTALQPGDEAFPRDAEGNILYEDVPLTDTWQAMEKCVETGLVKAIGVSNFNSQQMKQIVNNCKIKPATNQIEVHPYFSQYPLTKYCEELGVPITAYSPFGSPDSPFRIAGDPLLLDDPQLKSLAEKKQKTTAQVILRWLMQRNIISIPKSVTPSRIADNFNVFDFTLDKFEMETMDSFNRDCRMVVPYKILDDGSRVFRDKDAPNFPFNIPF